MRKVSINGVELSPKESVCLRNILSTYVYTASQFILSCAEDADHIVARDTRTKCFEMIQMIEEDLEIKYCQTEWREENAGDTLKEQPSIIIGDAKLIDGYGMALRRALGAYSSYVQSGLPISVGDMKELIRVIMSTDKPMQ